MAEYYTVRVAKDELVFSAGHFITFGGGTCERLHGHNYRVAAEVSAPLDANYYVVDFVYLRKMLKAILDGLDHRMMLPTQHASIKVEADDREVVARFESRRWVFPRGDCVLLDIPNTTAELLARHIGQQLRGQLPANIERVEIEVDECDGQAARWHWKAVL